MALTRSSSMVSNVRPAVAASFFNCSSSLPCSMMTPFQLPPDVPSAQVRLDPVQALGDFVAHDAVNAGTKFPVLREHTAQGFRQVITTIPATRDKSPRLSPDGSADSALIQFHKLVGDVLDARFLALLQPPAPQRLQRAPRRRPRLHFPWTSPPARRKYPPLDLAAGSFRFRSSAGGADLFRLHAKLGWAANHQFIPSVTPSICRGQ